MSEPTPDRDERHVEAMVESLRRSLETGQPVRGLEQLGGAAFGEDRRLGAEAKRAKQPA